MTVLTLEVTLRAFRRQTVMQQSDINYRQCQYDAPTVSATFRPATDSMDKNKSLHTVIFANKLSLIIDKRQPTESFRFNSNDGVRP